MKSLLHLLIIILSISVVQNNVNVSVHSQCLRYQRSLLLQFKQSLSLDFNESSARLRTWNSSTDCCSWGGVTCHFNGHVVGLDLSDEQLYIMSTRVIMINGSSTLFSLQYLQHLNLSNSYYIETGMPTKFDRFVNLSYLNLHNAFFAGQIPMEISNLTQLVVLDLSNGYTYSDNLMTELLDLRMFVQNLSRVTELYLDKVRIKGNDWSRAISSSLPNLKVLSFSGCELSGPIDSSLQNLRSLSVINLANNNLSSSIPEFFTKFSNLSSLILSGSSLHGTVPKILFQVPTLKILDFSDNDQLHGSLPDFYLNGSLQKLNLCNTSFSGIIPHSIGNLKMVSALDLSKSNFSGMVPSSIADLKKLVSIDLSFNNLGGHMPSLSGMRSLIEVNMRCNKLNGSISSTNWKELSNLVVLDLRNNSIYWRNSLVFIWHIVAGYSISFT